MASKHRLTPAEIEKASKVYTETANLSEAARSIGVGESTLRYAFKRLKIASNRDAHTRACERGVRAARKAIRHGLGKIPERFDIADSAKEFADVMRAATDAARTLLQLEERAERRRLSALQRSKLRAEVKAIEGGGGEGIAKLILPAVLVDRWNDSSPGSDPVQPESEAGGVSR